MLCPRCGGAIAQHTGEFGFPSSNELVPEGGGELPAPSGTGELMAPDAAAFIPQGMGEGVPPFTGEVVPPFTGEVPISGAPVTNQVYTSAPEPEAFVDPPTARDPALPQPPEGSSPPESSLQPEMSPQPPRLFGQVDPEAELHTVMVSNNDRQETLETRLVEAPPPVKAPESPDKKGLPDSRVARGVEDSMLEIKRQLFRFGRIGRVSFYSYILVIIGAVCPWFYVPHLGYTPGVEGWGSLALALSLGCIGLLVWRHRPKPKARALPVLFHLLLSAGLVLLLLWRYQVTREMGEHIRPLLSLGFYLTALGAIGAFVGALVGLKHVR